jgi:hypothetical protein
MWSSTERTIGCSGWLDLSTVPLRVTVMKRPMENCLGDGKLIVSYKTLWSKLQDCRPCFFLHV